MKKPTFKTDFKNPLKKTLKVIRKREVHEILSVLEIVASKSLLELLRYKRLLAG